VCGICGIVDPSGVERDVLNRMTSVLQHRGPDDDGCRIAGGVGLGFRRLSIIDLETGNQPISNEDGSVWTVFNGEIYNFRELRSQLEQQGHRFATNADTEVLVHLYEEEGRRCVGRLNGMFAFAIWDERRRVLLLARDRFGKKPLYYFQTPRGLVFGSELKALLQHPSCPAEIDRDALAQYLAFEYVPAPSSILAGIYKVPAAHMLVWEDGRVSLERYWQLPFAPDEPPRPMDEYVEEFRALLRAAVGRRLISDVPLGAFLSGGIDSSSVVAAMSELMPRHDVKTFSVGFSERSFDESTHAREVARFFGTDHRETTFTAQVLLDVLPEVAALLDEPFADPSVLPTYVLSRFTREHVTVALGGDGGDELLAGYPTFPADHAAQLYRVPRAVHERVVVPLVDRLPVSTANFSTDFKIKRFVRGLGYPDDVRHAAWLGALTPEEQRTVLREPAHDPYARVRAVLADAPGDRVARLVHLYAHTYLTDDILVKVDRASMGCSLEVRAPFLDVELVEFLGRVPSNLKLRGFRTKHLLKLAFRDVLPPGIADRPKKGFGVPVAQWLKSDLRSTLEEELAPERLRRQGLFEPAEVQRLVQEHVRGRRDHRKPLWTLLMFQLWHRCYIDERTAPVAASYPARTLSR
jgi:asparagine synthase (glutamine-hydrolysing)